jgi:hypothetical protein
MAGLRLAHPSGERLQQLQAAEKQLGFVLVAYEPVRPESRSLGDTGGQPMPPAQLSEEQFEKLQTVEEETGVVLMAYQSVQ